MVAGIVGCACAGGADWTWQSNDDPLQPSRTRAATAMDQRVRDIEKPFECIEKRSNAGN